MLATFTNRDMIEPMSDDDRARPLPDHLARAVLRIMDGWSPPAPTFAPSTRFRLGNRDLSATSHGLTIDGDELHVRVDDLVALSLERIQQPDQIDEPFDGELRDGSRFSAEVGFPSFDHVAGHYWRVSHPNKTARLWVARLDGLDSLKAPGNVVVSRTIEKPDGWTETNNTRSHHFFVGAKYNYYLADRGDGKDRVWFAVVETDGLPPTREQLYPDMLALQFVLGRGFFFDVLHGIDESNEVVALVGGRHGRDHGARGKRQPPIPLELSGGHWASMFFTALSEAYRDRQAVRLYVALAFYLDALVGFHVENAYLVLHVALEATAYWLLGGDDGSEQPLIDKSKWKPWLQQHKDEIKALALPGRGDDLFNKMTSVPKRRAASRVVEEACALPEINLRLSDEMRYELDGRGLIVHAAIMFRESQMGIDPYQRRIAMIRTLLVALLARVVGYKGAIVGWEHKPHRPFDEPDPSWWPVDDKAREGACGYFVIKKSTS